MSAGWLEGALRTLLPPLAILLPGAVLVTGLSEIAASAMVAGVSRVGYGLVQLLLFALGILAVAPTNAGSVTAAKAQTSQTAPQTDQRLMPDSKQA